MRTQQEIEQHKVEWSVEMDARQERGLQIAALCKIERNHFGWKVPSQSGNGSYIVNLDGSEPICTCPDFETRHVKCKHIHAVEFTIKRETKPDGTTTYTKSVKLTCTQEWPAYNTAQREEKRGFMRLLHDLCQTIPQPPQTFGRPRLPLSDMVFGAALKVYSTVSGRRFMGDMETAHEKGYISRLPHYNSVFNYLENPTLTPILKTLIEMAAVPLKAVESNFAVDSSGFSTCRFDRWFDAKYGRERSHKKWLKAHIMCGVKTNVVTSIEVTPGNANDAPFLAPLVDSTAQRFSIAEVSADKGYSSARNLTAIADVGGTPYIPFKANTVGTGAPLWAWLYHYFMVRREDFLAHYHQRSNVETTFGMIKGKFGDSLRSKTETAQVSELLLKVLCHNICVLIQAMYEFGIQPTFWAESQVAPKLCGN
jgi:transposase